MHVNGAMCRSIKFSHTHADFKHLPGVGTGQTFNCDWNSVYGVRVECIFYMKNVKPALAVSLCNGEHSEP